MFKIYILSDVDMRKIVLALVACLSISTAYSQENACEKQWQIEQQKTIQIKKLKQQQCAYLWDDAKVVALLKNMNLKSKMGNG